MSRYRGDYEYTDELCENEACRDVAVEDLTFEGLCIVHLNEAYKMAEADARIKWAKENDD